MQARISDFVCRSNRPPLRRKRSLFLAVVLSAGLAAGCSSIDRWTGGDNSGGQTVQPVGVEFYLDFLRDMSAGDAVIKAELYDQTLQAYNAAPTTTNQLRLALAYGSAGHVGTDPTTARRLLVDLLAEPEALLPYEYALARVRLGVVEHWLYLESENRRLRDEANRELGAARAAGDRQLEAAQAENQQLRRALNDAQDKLDAVTSIERSVAGQDEDGNSSR